ncbi:MAG: Methylmalonyl-CoA mutase, partial [Myxococcaceae bacterium]|nr:Methylmalonyl-CoA mutase [Myxococcaceae bacterium]
ARFSSAIASAELGAAFSALRAALSGGSPARASALVRERLAQPFETLRDRSDRALEKRGQRPRVFLANLGPIPEHKARASYAQNFVEAGGFVALTNLGFQDAAAAAEAFVASGAELAALCSSDGVYAELAVPTAQALQKAGARAIILAGNPGDREATYRAAGVTDFIYVGVNAVDTLRSLLERAGAQ